MTITQHENSEDVVRTEWQKMLRLHFSLSSAYMLLYIDSDEQFSSNYDDAVKKSYFVVSINLNMKHNLSHPSITGGICYHKHMCHIL